MEEDWNLKYNWKEMKETEGKQEWEVRQMQIQTSKTATIREIQVNKEKQTTTQSQSCERINSHIGYTTNLTTTLKENPIQDLSHWKCFFPRKSPTVSGREDDRSCFVLLNAVILKSSASGDSTGTGQWLCDKAKVGASIHAGFYTRIKGGGCSRRAGRRGPPDPQS